MSAGNELIEYNHLHSEMGAVYHEAALRAGLSDSVMNILYTVVTLGEDCTQATICALSGISRQTINSAIRKLEREGMVYLENQGGKHRPIRLTQKGQALAQEKVLPMVRAEEAIFAAWPQEDREALMRLTRQYLEDFKKNLEEVQRL